jgi:hypothetical protein
MGSKKKDGDEQLNHETRSSRSCMSEKVPDTKWTTVSAFFVAFFSHDYFVFTRRQGKKKLI